MCEYMFQTTNFFWHYFVHQLILEKAIKAIIDPNSSVIFNLKMEYFEELYMDLLQTKASHILTTIRDEKVLTEKIDAELKAILEDFIPNSGLKMKSWALTLRTRAKACV